ncbi:O-antigen ligase family protein [Crocinitomicaceae bacterium]|nr:O-antigen ligase family protein [Crocinitomicaceae bacterium]
MTFQLKSYNFNDFCLTYIVFFSIVYQAFVPIGFILWILTIWLNLNKRPINLSQQFKDVEFWFILYYLLLIIGMFWTDNQIFGLSKIENKLSFILFPILFRFSKINLNRRTIFSILLFGLFISLLFYESVGVYKSIYYPVVEHYSYLTGAKFTVFMHRGYFSLYLIIGISVCIARILNKKKLIIHLLLYAFFTLGLFQTLSKAGVLCFIVVHIIYIIHTIMNKWKTVKKKHIVFLLAVSMIAILFSIKSVIVRIDKTIYALNHIKLEDNNSIESNQARLIMWNTSVKLIKDNFIYGTGTGDYNDELIKRNKRYQNLGVVSSELNSHNQFLNTFVQLGLIGFLVLSAIFYSYFRIAFKNRDLLIVIIGVSFLLNFLFESIIETQSGIILFCILFICSTSSELRKDTLKTLKK